MTARGCVLLSGAMLATAAFVVLVFLPIDWQLRVLAGLLGCGAAGFDLWRCWRSYRGIGVYRLYADGSVDIEAPDGTRSGGAIASGTVTLRNLAWFRCRGTNGRIHAELIPRKSQERDDWRRFRVICRHVAAC